VYLNIAVEDRMEPDLVQVFAWMVGIAVVGSLIICFTVPRLLRIGVNILARLAGSDYRMDLNTAKEVFQWGLITYWTAGWAANRFKRWWRAP
jgi:hypothetical protein